MPSPNKGESKQDFLKRCTQELIEVEGREADQAYKLCNITWDDSKNQRSVLSLQRPVEMMAGKTEDSARQFMITAYTGKPIETWWGQVIFDLNGMQAKEKIPVLREHFRDRVVGFGQASQDGKNYYVKGEFSSSTNDAMEVLALAEEGYPWQASVAIWPKVVKTLETSDEKETVNGREIQGPAEIWLESEVGEVSFVSLGRDNDTAAISLTESEGKVPVRIENKIIMEDKNMEFTIELLEKEAPELLAKIREEAAAEAEKKGQEQGVAAERERVVEILKADADPEQTREAIESGIEANAAYKKFYEAEKSKRAKGLEELKAEATESQGLEDPEEKKEQKKTSEETRREWSPMTGPAAKAA